jgi:hypothetical protein
MAPDSSIGGWALAVATSAAVRMPRIGEVSTVSASKERRG